ncbi:branched-chain amino acid ABC transporter permease [Natrarchaeobius halalkaliphilus]|uniref:Branched-chain amino acid ABC transporter permease n=1 Tax=Natrarchaeobius halalkaliphilus TaxID=1679091 RepID=A0A3N6NU88_9EURY|nr:branched-chain amino acid ABC transporter permease [Natrarchaeobius halalkaliphilus]RQG86710.1 branched-chain amino acid ABC transporter permease [Natrarchaeobius halalkaliphilus]
MLDLGQIAFAIINGLVFGSILALIAVGLSLIYGVLDVPNFAQGEFATLSGFIVVGLMGFGLGLVPSIIVAIVAAVVAGIALERLVIARFYGREEFLLLTFFATFGVTIISENAHQMIFGGFRQIQGPELGTISLVGSTYSLLNVLSGVFAIIMIIGLYIFTKYTYTGLAMRAVADDQTGTEILGINYGRIYMVTFALGGALTGISGILYGMSYTLSPTLGVLLTLFAFTIVVVGGIGSFQGAIIASFLVGLVESFASTFIGSQWRLFAVFFLLFVVLILRPQGIGGVRS